jgi:hypothetical protein
MDTSVNINRYAQKKVNDVRSSLWYVFVESIFFFNRRTEKYKLLKYSMYKSLYHYKYSWKKWTED